VITFRVVVKQALAQALKRTEDDRDMKRFGDVLAEELRAHFRLHGYAIKATAVALELGRPMTHEEQLAVGLIPLDGDVPGEGVRTEDAVPGLASPPPDSSAERVPPARRRNKSSVRR
jgi:hypothetical protein